MMDEDAGSRNVLQHRADAGFVEVMFARTDVEAAELVAFLTEQHIPAKQENAAGLMRGCGVAILVPANRFVEASELLAARTQDEEEDTDDEVSDDDDLDTVDDDDDLDDDEDEDDEDDFDDDDEEEEEEEESLGGDDF